MCSNKTFKIKTVKHMGIYKYLQISVRVKHFFSTSQSIVPGYLKSVYVSPCVYIDVLLHLLNQQITEQRLLSVQRIISTNSPGISTLLFLDFLKPVSILVLKLRCCWWVREGR